MTASHQSPLRRRAGLFVLWVCLGLVFGSLLAAAGPLALGDRSFTMRSGSMTPAIEAGDVVVTEPLPPLSVEVGDIVTFRDPEGSGRLYSHRVQSIRRAGNDVRFVTRGDANTATEHWSVPADGTVGKVLYRIPKIGYALVWTGTIPFRIVLIAIPALLLCGGALARIWRPRPKLGRVDR
ncbi:MAG: signal peptidase [Solirubrobacterales bacterium]|nr:signal peptidase [Solirubrobacterales bacterium]